MTTVNTATSTIRTDSLYNAEDVETRTDFYNRVKEALEQGKVIDLSTDLFTRSIQATMTSSTAQEERAMLEFLTWAVEKNQINENFLHSLLFQLINIDPTGSCNATLDVRAENLRPCLMLLFAAARKNLISSFHAKNFVEALSPTGPAAETAYYPLLLSSLLINKVIGKQAFTTEMKYAVRMAPHIVREVDDYSPVQKTAYRVVLKEACRVLGLPIPEAKL